MKVIRTLVVLDRGNVIDSVEWEKIHSAYTDTIRAMVHPPGSKNFTLRQKTRKLNRAGKPTSQWNRNGVTAIKEQFLDERLKGHWKLAHPLNISAFMENYKTPKEAEELNQDTAKLSANLIICRHRSADCPTRQRRIAHEVIRPPVTSDVPGRRAGRTST